MNKENGWRRKTSTAPDIRNPRDEKRKGGNQGTQLLFSTFVLSGVSKEELLQRKQGQVPRNPLPLS